MKRFITDTAVLAFLTIFSYFIFLLKETGYLNAFGFFDASGLIPLQVQSIIPSVFSIVVLTVGVLSLSLGLTSLARFIVKKRGKRVRGTVMVVSLFFTIGLIELPLLIEAYFVGRGYFIEQIILLAGFSLIFFIILPVTQMGRTKKNYEFSLFSLTKPLDKLLGKFSKEDTARVSIMVSVIFLMMLPLFAYSYGYISANIQKNFFITSDGSVKYVLVRQYGNEIILAEIKNNEVLPSYKIEYLDSNHPINFYTLKNSKLNFSKTNYQSSKGVLHL